MSASREKKNRQEQGWVDPKTAREARQRKEEKRSNLLYGTIFVVFLLVAVAAIVWKSNIIPRTATAVTINGEKYTAAEVNFYYQNAYQNFMSTVSSYGMTSYIGIDTSTSLKNQTVSSMGALFASGAEEGESWYDYFLEIALDNMAAVQAMNEAAEAEGFTWTDEMQAELDENLESLAAGAATYGYTEKQYLTMIFGSTMTQSIYEEQTKRSILASYYQTAYEDSLVYTEDELEAAYEADRTTYDLVSAQYVNVSGAVADTDEDGNEIEVTDEMAAEGMAAAKAYADQIYADWQAGGDLEDLAEACEGSATYTSSDSISYTGSALTEWLFDDARAAGDSTVLEDADSSAYYVVVFESRGRNDYNTVDVRHILITPEESELSSDDEGYEEDVAAKEAEALQQAEALLAEWKAGEATEDSFAQLAMENSDDGSASDGGLYTEVYQGQMVTEFNDWCFDPDRQSGDTGVIETTYGAHVMYFVGYDIPYWQVQVRDDLKEAAVEEWYEEKTADMNVVQGSGIKYVG